MFRRSLLPHVRPRPSDEPGLVYDEGVEEGGVILAGRTRLPATGETYPVKNGYLDLLKGRLGGDNVANLTNFLPGAGHGYEPLWRVRSLTLLTGEYFPNDRELEIIARGVGLERGGLYLDLGLLRGLYTRILAALLGGSGDVVGVDISPSMLREAARRARKAGVAPSLRPRRRGLPPLRGRLLPAPSAAARSTSSATRPRPLRETHRVLEPGARLAIMGILRARTPNGRRLQRFPLRRRHPVFHPGGPDGALERSGVYPGSPDGPRRRFLRRCHATLTRARHARAGSKRAPTPRGRRPGAESPG
jgi:SAM-dependent methyltransferase